jgi:hypothetical protein
VSGAAVLADLIALGGAGAAVTELNDRGQPARHGPGVVRIGVHRTGSSPSVDFEAFDILLSTDADARAPWVGCDQGRLDETLAALREQIARHPVAAAVAAQVMRASLSLQFPEALAMESLAYSMLLAGE